MESHNAQRSNRPQKKIKVTGEITAKFYIVPEHKLEIIDECSDSKKDYDMSLWYFAIAIGVFTSICTTDIQNKIMFGFLVASGCVTLVLGLVKRNNHRRKLNKAETVIKSIKEENSS